MQLLTDGSRKSANSFVLRREWWCSCKGRADPSRQGIYFSLNADWWEEGRGRTQSRPKNWCHGTLEMEQTDQTSLLVSRFQQKVCTRPSRKDCWYIVLLLSSSISMWCATNRTITLQYVLLFMVLGLQCKYRKYFIQLLLLCHFLEAQTFYYRFLRPSAT